jgi:uncharacterized protein
MDNVFIKRQLLQEIKEHLHSPEITLIVGPRQAGKTTLMKVIKAELEKKGEKTVFLSLDIEEHKEFFASQAIFLKKINLEFGNKRGFVFIDEIQRKENAGLFLKGIYDVDIKHKLIVSGSGSLELKEKIKESLTGRKRVFELNTLNFEEFVNFKTNYKYEDKILDFFEVEKNKSWQLLEEFLSFGGYPRVVLADSFEEKKKSIDEIYQSYIEKDISYLLSIKKQKSFSDLVRILASQIGNLINYSEIASTLGISIETVKNYLWYLEKTFVIERITPYFQNVRKEITKAPQFYFKDLGLRNYILGILGNLSNQKDVGFLFQNFIFNILKSKLKWMPAKINFWRTKDGAEVDFVISYGNQIIPIEIKYRQIKKIEISNSLRSFIKKYKPPKVFIVNLSYEEKIDFKGAQIIFLPFWKFVFMNFEI